ncbi:MAG TPA: hydantoinase B/oxoprolinase family protein [Solirubrobacteraceae bacterium]|jgi:N-methylhydantoinase B|nr:hydantoinase B/oxoprolinase family protein [Solirubrobacteraceae bacterium]
MTTEAIDLVDLEIFTRALENVANEMGTVMIRASGSPVIAEAVDFSTFILDGDGALLAFGGYIAFHAGPARQAVRHVLSVIDESEIRPGDVFICNDPHTTGNAHQPDVGVIKPTFHEGRRVAWAWAEAHTYDVGGMAPGGFAPMATETYGEGLRLPGVKIVSEGRPLEDVWRLIESNVRVPTMVLNDVRCMIAACNRGEQRVLELIERWGSYRFADYAAASMDIAERAVRDRVATLPDGSWTAEDYAEHNGHANELFRVRCAATVQGDQLTLDFSGSAAQTEGFINCSLATTVGMAITPLVMTLAPDLPINEGTFRAVEVIAQSGTICNPQMPAPTSSGHMETGLRVLKVVQRLLADLQLQSSEAYVRGHVMAPWHDCWPGAVMYAPLETGELVPFLDMHGGTAGGGAQPIADGMDCAASLCQLQNSVPDIEINEFQFPILYLWRRLSLGSGGAGRHRGGQGVDLGWTPWRTPGGVGHFFLSCWQVPSPGTDGGYPGSTSRFAVRQGGGADRLLQAGSVPDRAAALDGELVELQAKHFGFPLAPGDVVTMRSGGGGGLGDPLERDPDAVARDARDGAIDRDAARGAYGVVLDEGGEVDRGATDALRERVREERRAWPGGARVSGAGERIASLGGWCQPREGVDLVEHADPETGRLLKVEPRVSDGGS